MKLCVFQGTFNPIHKAHLRVAGYIADKIKPDKFLFIPAYIPPHKASDVNFAKHRLNMVRLAVQGDSRFEVSDIEFHRDGKSYTYETILELYKMYDITGKICFVIGTDAFKHIESWYKTDELKKLVKFVVFIRENDFEPEKYEYLKAKGYDFEFQVLPYEDISSTNIRLEMHNHDEHVKIELPEKVMEYIEEHELYKS